MSNNIQGKVVAITGASSGLGEATARDLSAQGATVVLGARRADRIKSLADELTRRGGKALAVPTDVTRSEQVKKLVDGEEKEVDETKEELVPGYLEAVYHLFSIAHKHGPVVIRMRTANRAEGARLPSLTPIYRSAEFQEREIFDLYGVHFDNHPDLRRILMWDEFVDHPMRKDYREPDDYEYEPTPHDDVLERAKQHYGARPPLDGAENVTASQ